MQYFSLFELVAGSPLFSHDRQLDITRIFLCQVLMTDAGLIACKVRGIFLNYFLVEKRIRLGLYILVCVVHASLRTNRPVGKSVKNCWKGNKNSFSWEFPMKQEA
jgi:hypothetical protein